MTLTLVTIENIKNRLQPAMGGVVIIAIALTVIVHMIQVITTRDTTIGNIYLPGLQFSFQHVEGIGGDVHNGPQGVAFDPVTQMLYPTGGHNGNHQTLKMNLSGTVLATNNNPNGRSKIQDAGVREGKLYVPYGEGLHTEPEGQTGYVIRFDLDLNYEYEYLLPMNRYSTAITFKHGYWWLATYDYTVHQLSADFSTVIAVHDVSAGNKPSTIKSYGGMDWYGKYLFGAEHDASEVDVWYWNGSTLALVQEMDVTGFDLHNGLAFDEANEVLYASSRTLSDDVQKYNVLIN